MAIGGDAQAIIDAINALKSETTGKESKSGGLKAPGAKREGESAEDFDKRMQNYAKLLELEMKSSKAKAENLRLDFQLSSAMLDREEKMKNLLALDQQKQEIEKQLLEAANDLADETRQKLEDELGLIDEVLEKNQDLLEGYKNLTEAQKKAMKMGADAADKLANKFGLTTKASKTMTGQMMEFTNVMKEAGASGQFMKSFGAGMLNLPLSLLDSVVKTMIDMIFALDNAQTSFNKATAFAGAYDDEIGQLSESHLHLGIAAKEAGDAYLNLSNKFADFAVISRDQRTELSLAVASMEQLGVAGETTAGIMDYFNKVGGTTVDNVADMAEKFLMSGTAIGISASKMGKDFMASLPKLAVYGNRAEEIFMDLAGAAKSAGIETSALLNVAGKFDTFAGAAEATGKLNAILGTQMSATEMLMMTEEERIETLILQVQSSGMAFRDMDRFTQKAIAAAAGITDMNEANRIFGMDLGQYGEYQEEMSANAKSQKEFEDAIAETIPVQRMMQLGFMQLATDFGPQLLETLRNLATMFLQNGDEIKKNIKFGLLLYAGFRVAIPLISGVSAAYRYKRLQTSLDTIAQGKNQVSMKMSNVQMVAQGKLMKGNGIAALGLAAKIAAVGAAILLAGIGIYIAVKGFVDLANAMAQMQDNAGLFVAVVGLVIAGFVGLAFALVGMTAAGAPAAPVLLAVGAAVALMGLGIGLAAAGIGFMAQGLSTMGAEGLIAVGVVGLFATIMYALTPALFSGSIGVAALGTAATASAPGLLVLAKAILVVSVGVGIMAAAFALMFDRAAAFGKAIKGTAADSRAMAAALTEMGFAAILNGNPIALAGLAAQTLFASSQKTTIDIGGAEGMKALAEGMEKTANLAAGFEGVAANMTAIATGLTEIDSSLGGGKKRVEIISTLEHLATLATANTGETLTRANTTVAQVGATAGAQTVNVQNTFGPLEIVLEDGTKLAGYINKVRNAAGRT